MPDDSPHSFFRDAAEIAHAAQPVQGRRLLDTDSMTINLSFGGPSIYCRGILPYVTLNGPDGEVEFVGLADMQAARDALIQACEIAERVAA
jgi:hypothetical protein